MSLLLPDCLLVLTVLFVRPAPGRAWSRRLALHAMLLSGCLFATLLTPDAQARTSLHVAGLIASLIQLALIRLVFLRFPAEEPDPAAQDDRAGAGWLVAAVLLVASAVRIVPDAVHPRGMVAVTVAMVLCGLLGTVASRSRPGRIGSLLLAGDALVLAACGLPGMDLLSFCTVSLLQAGLLLAFFQARTTPHDAMDASS